MIITVLSFLGLIYAKNVGMCQLHRQKYSKSKFCSYIMVLAYNDEFMAILS